MVSEVRGAGPDVEQDCDWQKRRQVPPLGLVQGPRGQRGRGEGREQPVSVHERTVPVHQSVSVHVGGEGVHGGGVLDFAVQP